MKFQVVFYENICPYSFLRKTSGLADLRNIRSKLNLELDAKLVSDHVQNGPAARNQQTITISEYLADRTGRFEHAAKIRVNIDSTKDYWYKISRFERNEETGEVYKAWAEYELNEDALISDWAAQGYPLEMVAPSEEEE